MLTKATITAGVLLAGLMTVASAQTAGGPTANSNYEPTGNFQALWGSPTNAPAQATRDVSSRQSYAKQRTKQAPSRKSN